MAYDDQEIYGYVDEGEDISGNVESGDDIAGQFDDYIKGDPGIGIESMVQIQSASESGGMNVWRATLSDGTVHDFVVRNGLQGEQGIQGEKGDKGDTGETGATGAKGDPGEGIATGGTPGQVLLKASNADYATRWMDILPEDTASGAVASFPDGSDDLPMGVVVYIDPVQDLHGYDSPWPAGGGKNLFDKTKVANVAERVSVEQIDNGFKITNLSAGTYRSTSFYADFAGHDGETVYLKGNVSNSGSNNGYFSVRFYDDTSEISTASTRVELYSTRTSHTGTVPTGTTRVAFVIYGTGSSSAAAGDTTTFTNVIFSLSNDAYSPYSNICPVSGWTGAKVTRTGVNVWDEEWEIGQYATSTGQKAPSNVHIRCVNPIPVKPSTAYFFSTAGYNINVCFMDAKMKFISNFNSVHDVERTTPSNCYFVVFNMAQAYGTTYNNNISINLPSSIHDYYPYQGQSVTIPFGQTVYGGTLNVATGECVVDKAMVTFDGSSDESWTVDSLNRAYTQINAIKKESNYSQSMKCDKLRLVSNQSPVIDTDYSISGYYDVNASYPNRNWVYLKLTNAYNTVASIIEWLTANPITIVYALAAPIPIILTAVEISSLLGDNNVWSDTGNTAVTYKADIQKYIDKKISAAVAAMS